MGGSQGLRKIPEVQQMFFVRRRWKPQELHLFLLLLKHKFIYVTFFLLKQFSAKLMKWNAGQSHELPSLHVEP